jgi:hypothetical protein
MADIPVKEKVRTLFFSGGQRRSLHNVTSFNPDGTFLRLECDEGYVLANPQNIDLIVIPDKTERVV